MAAKAKVSRFALVDHIDLRVRNLSETRPLYDAIMPILGFKYPVGDESDGCICYDSATGAMELRRPFVALLEDKEHVPSPTRIAFYAPGRRAVDEVAAVAERYGARTFEAAHFCPEYGPEYYACFFEDAVGNKIEVCCRHASDEGLQRQERSVVRMWRGRTHARDIDRYRQYVERTGLADCQRCPGNLGAVVLTRVEGEIAEIVTLSFWQSMDAIRLFAGDEPEKARYYPEDAQYLLEFEPYVRHFEAFPSSTLMSVLW